MRKLRYGRSGPGKTEQLDKIVDLIDIIFVIAFNVYQVASGQPDAAVDIIGILGLEEHIIVSDFQVISELFLCLVLVGAPINVCIVAIVKQLDFNAEIVVILLIIFQGINIDRV